MLWATTKSPPNEAGPTTRVPLTATWKAGPAGATRWIDVVVVTSGRVTEKVRSTAVAPVLTWRATVPDRLIDEPRAKTAGRPVAPPPSDPEKVAATPEEVMRSAPCHWWTARTVTALPRLRVSPATAMLTSGEVPVRRSMTTLPPRVWPATPRTTPVATTRKPGFSVTVCGVCGGAGAGTVMSWLAPVVLKRTWKAPARVTEGTSSWTLAATCPYIPAAVSTRVPLTPVSVTSGEAAEPSAIRPLATVTVRVVPTFVTVMSAPSDSPSARATTTATPRARSSGVVLFAAPGSLSSRTRPPMVKLSATAVVEVLISTTKVPDRRTPGTLRRATVPLSEAATPVPLVTSRASPPVRVRTVRVPSPSESSTFVAATLMNVVSASAPVPPTAPSAPSDRVRSTDTSPRNVWPPTSRTMPVPAIRTNGPAGTSTDTEEVPTCRLCVTRVPVVLTATSNAPVSRRAPPRLSSRLPPKDPAIPVAETTSRPRPRTNATSGAGLACVSRRTTEALERPSRTTVAPVAVVTCSTTTSALSGCPMTVIRRSSAAIRR